MPSPALGGTDRAPGVAALGGRDRLILGAVLLAVVGLAWAYLVMLDAHMAAMLAKGAMGEMMQPWTARDLGFTLLMWIVMMIGMMAPAATPVLHLYAKAQAGRGRAPVPATLWFALGYILAWSAFSVGATLVQWALHAGALLSPAMATSSPRLGGVLLCAAGVYQLTPLKRACLGHCRSPLGFLLSRWRDGPWGALAMGARHGAYCLGCCWALMGLLFVAGVMNLLWVAALALLVLVEKAAPAGGAIARIAGVIMLGVGVAVLIGGW